MDLCSKFSDCSFSRLGSIRADKQTHSQTDADERSTNTNTCKTLVGVSITTVYENS